MFSGSFSSGFAGRGQVGRGAFASGFAGCFSGRGAVPVGYIGPMRAQAALVGGVAWFVSGSALVVGGFPLIGPAGKVYAFKTPESAAKWAANTKGVGEREVLLMATIDPATAAAWKAKKRAKLALVAARLVKAAGGAADDRKRAALLAESDYCLSKWQ